MTRIAHLTTADISLRYLLLNQLRYLQAQGYDVTAISAPGPHVPVLAAAGIRHLPVPMTRRMTTPVADLRALRALTAVMRAEGFSLVHTHSPKGGLLGQLAARRAGVPIVINTIHGYYFTERHSRLYKGIYSTLERLAARWSDVIFFQSEEDLATARRLGLGRSAQWRYLGNGIDLHRFDPQAVDLRRVAQLRDEFGLPEGTPTVGFVGRLVREKGILDLLAALRMIRGVVPTVRALIVGPVDEQKPDAVTPSAAARVRVEDSCIFTGEREDLPELYALMTVFALPSHREGFPRTPMEASAMEIPCVVTDIRGCRQVVEEGHNGFRVSVGDPPGLARAIITLLTDPQRARLMGEAGRRMAEERFDERSVFSRILSEYAGLLGARGLPVPSAFIQPA